MESLFLRGSLLGTGLMAIALAGVGNPQLVTAQMVTEITENQSLTPLPQSEGNAQDLTGTLAKDSALWLGGVGGDGDIEATESDDNPYEIRSRQSDLSPLPSSHGETPAQQRIQLGQF